MPILVLWNLGAGPLEITLKEYYDALFHFDINNKYQVAAREVKFTRMVVGLIAGGALAIAGLLMQTLFNNPLAGPYVLGINSGSSLFVAFGIMTGIPLFSSDLGLITNAVLGAIIFGVIILVFARSIRSQISLLLVGLMLGSFTSAIIALLQSVSNANELKQYTMWSLGSLKRINFDQLWIIVLVFFISLILVILLIKPLNALVIGEKQAKLLGIRFRQTQLLIILITALLTAVVTAFCGPIAFVGLAVPNLVRILFKTRHHGVLILACLFGGGCFILLCDIAIQELESTVRLPINVLTSMIGAPIVIGLLIRRVR